MNLPMASRFEARSRAVSVTWLDQGGLFKFEGGGDDRGQRHCYMSAAIGDSDVVV